MRELLAPTGIVGVLVLIVVRAGAYAAHRDPRVPEAATQVVAALGRSLDPLDFLMCALGVLAAVVVDRAASSAAEAAPQSSSQEARP